MQITVEIADQKDVQLFREIVNRLGFKITQEKETLSDKELAHHLEVIAKGIQEPSVSLEERLKDLEESSKDRKMPFR
ncbi:MAG: hypothetical protein AAF798_04585 [Bacteroidota bacterium]